MKIYFVTGTAIAMLVLSLSLGAQTMPRKSSSSSPSPSTTSSPTKQAARPLPFHGMVSAVDQKARTFTISGKEKSRLFKVTDKSAITRAGKTATMKDIVENQEISGSAWQNADGTLEAKMVKLGPMEKAKTPTTSPTTAPQDSASPKP
jgi:hypothetical protein